jgi:hypothetical protein
MSNAIALDRHAYYNQWTPADGADDKKLAKLFIADVIENNKKRVDDWSARVDSALSEIRAECFVDGWDGDGGTAITETTLELSRKVVTLLHAATAAGTPPPELVPESDGELALSWTRTPEMVFSISIGAHGFLNYAGTLSDGVEAHDVARFIPGDTMAIAKLAALLKQLYK